MLYCELADLEARIDRSALERVAWDEDTDGLDLRAIEEAIRDASAEIDAYAQKRYRTPIVPVPRIIRRLAADIAIYRLFSRHGFDEEGPDKDVVRRYTSAVQFLENLAKGLVSIGEVAPPSRGTAHVVSSRRVFTRKSMEGW